MVISATAAYADLLEGLVGHCISVRHGLALLRRPAPDPGDAILDSHSRMLSDHLHSVRAALEALPRQIGPMPASQLLSRAELGDVLDAIASCLLAQLGDDPERARRLAVATARLLEDGHVLRSAARRQIPLGRGFEALLLERVQRRFALLPGHPDLLHAVRRHIHVLMEEPDEAVAQIERELDREISAEERCWLEAERKAAMLRRVRHSKTEDGHIRWYLRNDPQYGVVLDRFGMRGHWIVCGKQPTADLARLGAAVERITDTPLRPGNRWHLVTTERYENPAGCANLLDTARIYLVPSGLADERDVIALRTKLRRKLSALPDDSTCMVFQALASRPSPIAAAPPFKLTADNIGVYLENGSSGERIAGIRHDANTENLLSFLDSVDCVADWTLPTDCIGGPYGSNAVLLTRKLLDICSRYGRRDLKVRLVYVPSDIEHQLGGVPMIGLDFLRDRMEREGARVHVLTMRSADFGRRSCELQGADVIGIGVYIHNVSEVAQLVAQLRDGGFAGQIVLGGPQLRDIDQILTSITGWDALVRGEAEDVLPRVLEVLTLFRCGQLSEALAAAQLLTGVAVRHGQALILCDTATRNRAESIRCPLPFHWTRNKPKRRLQMNFTRGCPYLCTFCPNHQGQLYRAGPADELWRYAILSVADDLPLPSEVEQAVVGRIQTLLGIEEPCGLAVALHLLIRAGCDATELFAVCEPLADFAGPALCTSPRRLKNGVGLTQTLERQRRLIGDASPTAWQIKETWLLAKAAVLGTHRCAAKPPFVLMTSEDNTLVNRPTVREFLRRRSSLDMDRYFVFNPGQNTVWDLTDGAGGADEAYIADLVNRNPFAVALGVDGPSNPVIRQNRKPRYRIQEVLAVNRSLRRHGVRVANNYILLTPETDLLEAIEAFMLFLLLPLPWRDYGESINLRVIKEDGTLAHDEGLLFSPSDPGYDEPMRFKAVQDLLDRWSLTSNVPSDEIKPLLWRILREDGEAAACLPLVVNRWVLDFDGDSELLALGHEIRAQSTPDVPLIETLRTMADQLLDSFPG